MSFPRRAEGASTAGIQKKRTAKSGSHMDPGRLSDDSTYAKASADKSHRLRDDIIRRDINAGNAAYRSSPSPDRVHWPLQ